MRAERAQKTALVRAVDLLARRAHSERELRLKLAARGYEELEIEAAVERLKAERYLDDAALCRDLAAAYLEERKYGYRYIRCKLRERGFAADIVAEALGVEDEERELAAAAAVLARKYDAQRTGPEKIYRFLLSRGFSESTAQRALRAAGSFET